MRSIRIFTLLFLAFTGAWTAIAQSITYPDAAPAENLTRGLGEGLLTVHVDFTSDCGTTATVTLELGATNDPGTVEYIIGSVTKTVNTTSGVDIIESDISNLSKPVFKVSGVILAAHLEFTVMRRINCGTANSTKDFVYVDGGGSCSAHETDEDENTYNISAPALTLVAPATINNADLGSQYSRTISVTNGGTGCLDTLFFWIKYPTGFATLDSLRLDSLKIGSIKLTPLIKLTPAYVNADSAFFKVAGSLLGNDNTMCNGTTVYFTEYFTITNCSGSTTTTYGTAWNDFHNDYCQIESKTGNVVMSNKVPTLSTSVVTDNPYDYCLMGESKIQTVRITNTGTGIATDVSLHLRNWSDGGYQSSLFYFDTNEDVTVKNADGNIIDVLHDFSDLEWTSRMEGAPGTACGNVSRVRSYTVNLGNIVIPAGSYIDVEIKTIAKDMRCDGCLDESFPWIGLYTALDYKNQCGTKSYTDNYKGLLSRTYMFPQVRNIEVPIDIIGGEPFDFRLTVGTLRTIGHPDGTGYLKFYIDLKGKDIVPTVTEVTAVDASANTYTLAVNFVNDTLILGPFPNNIPAITGFDVKIPLMPTCGTGGVRTLNSWFGTKYSDCSPEIQFYCAVNSTRLHCPAPCPTGGATPYDFTLRRTTLGQPDNDNNGVPDGSGVLDMNRIELQRAVNGDTVRGTWKIRIKKNTDEDDVYYNQTISHVYIDFRLTPNNSLLPGDKGTFTTVIANRTAVIYPAGGGAPITCPNIPYTITNERYAHFEIGNSCHTWADGDIVFFTADFIAAGGTPHNGNSSGFRLFVTNNQVYGAYEKLESNQTAPEPGKTYTCDHLNDYIRISNIHQNLHLPPNQTINGCDNVIQASLRLYIEAQAYHHFPFEYRTFFIPEDFKILMPSGITYRSGSAKIGGTSIPDAQVSQVGDTLFFNNLSLLYKSSGGPRRNPDDRSIEEGLTFSVNPTCETPEGLFTLKGSQKVIGLGGAVPAIPSGWLNVERANALNTKVPAPKLNGGAIYHSTDGSGEWALSLQNQSNAVDAENTWLYLNNTSGFTNIVVKDGGSTVSPDGNGFYQLGKLLKSSTKNITITADNLSSCDADSLQVYTGFQCVSYPTSLPTLSCIENKWLRITHEASQIQLEVDQQPAGGDLCTEDTVIFTINSALGAYADNPKFIVESLGGVSITYQEIEWPAGSGNWESINPVNDGGKLIYNVEDHSVLFDEHGTKGLPGTIEAPGTNERQARLRIQFNTTCDFVSGSTFTVRQQADRPCGLPIPATLGYNSVVHTNPVNIDGAGANGTVDVSVSVDLTTISCDTAMIEGVLLPIEAAFSATDELKITLQKGLLFDVSSFNRSTGMYIVAGYPTTDVSGNEVILITIPEGTDHGTGNELHYQIDIFTGANSGCGSFEITTEIIREGAQLYCKGEQCPAPAKVIVGSKITNISVEKGSVEIVNAYIKPNVSDTYTITITNNGSEDINANDLKLDLTCGGSFIGSSKFPDQIPAGATVTADVLITSSGCVGSDIYIVAGTDKNCICGPSSKKLDKIDIKLEKEADIKSGLKVDDIVTYTFIVTNTGEVTLNDVSVSDPLPDLSTITPASVASLAPGASTTFTATYVIKQTDVDAGAVTNTATATGNVPNYGSVNDTDDETVTTILQNPSISLEKKAAPGSYDAGDVVTYTFIVTNTGNVTLSNVTVSDPLPDLSAISPASVAILAPGASTTFTATYVVKQTD
ncbi:MAG: hypothetical protein WBJ84_09780, partial [Bacteroidales bacterium]